MNIVEALKSDDVYVRLSSALRWMVWSMGRWEVLSKISPGYDPGHVTLLIRTESEEAAVAVLIGEE